MSIVVNNMADRGATPYFGYVAWRIRIYFRIVLFAAGGSLDLVVVIRLLAVRDGVRKE